MKSLKCASIVAFLCLYSFCSFSQNSEEDLDILRAQKAFKTKMQEEIITIQPESPSRKDEKIELKSIVASPAIYAKNDASPEKPVYQSIVTPVNVLTPEDKSKVRLAFFINGEKASTSRGISNFDKNISFKAFSLVERNELVITEFQIDLIRQGKKIASETLSGTGSIENLVTKSKEGDQFLVIIKDIYEKTSEGHLRNFTKGSLKLNLAYNN
jgi:hypothetical protein